MIDNLRNCKTSAECSPNDESRRADQEEDARSTEVRKDIPAISQNEMTGLAKGAPDADKKTDTALSGVTFLMKKAQMFMEDGSFQSASVYLDRVLDIDPEYAPAYAARVCAKFGLRGESGLAEAAFLYNDDPDWQKALKYADPEQKKVYEGYAAKVRERVNRQIRDYAYDCAMQMAVSSDDDRAAFDLELEKYRMTFKQPTGERADGKRRANSERNEKFFRQAVLDNNPGFVTEQGFITAAEMFEAIGDREANECAQHCRVLAEQARQKAVYNRAENLQKNGGDDPAVLKEAAGMYQTIPSYRDASKRAGECFESAENIRADRYDTAVKLMNDAGDDIGKWSAIREILGNKELDGCRNIVQLRHQADKRYRECRDAEMKAKWRAEDAAAAMRNRYRIIAVTVPVLIAAAIILVNSFFIPHGNYRNAVALQQAGKYEEAAMAFTALGDWGDSGAKVQECRYLAAVTLQQAGEFEEAIEAFMALGEYSDSAAQVTETRYLLAKARAARGDYGGAAEIFIGIRDHRDVDSLLANDQNLRLAAAAAAAEWDARFGVGQYVTFGQYPQTSGGKDSTPIEWLVLARDGQKALLISRYGLDAQPYYTYYTLSGSTYLTWEVCSLRTWLNLTFLNKAFTAWEQTGIVLTKVDNGTEQGYSGWSRDYWKDTEDRIFLLSYGEANRYLGVTNSDKNNTVSRAAPTVYAVQAGADTNSSGLKTAEGKAAGWWWLRSPGSSRGAGAVVDAYGCLDSRIVSYGSGCVRPALWIDLGSGIF